MDVLGASVGRSSYDTNQLGDARIIRLESVRAYALTLKLAPWIHDQKGSAIQDRRDRSHSAAAC